MGGRSSKRLRVLMYHDIAPNEEELFASHLRWLAKSWRFIDPARFGELLCGNEPVREDSLLVTFDDGFASNRGIVERVLNPLGIHALFFIVSGYASLSENDDWRGYVAHHIYPDMKPTEVPDHWQNMDWDDLSYLLETGHDIGSHSASHARLSKVTAADLENEIVGSANFLEEKLRVKVDHFAYGFGNLESFSPAALSLARRRFKYIHTGIRGDNACGVPPWAIRRDAIAPTDKLSLVGSFLEGGADRLYARKLSEYESWGNAEDTPSIGQVADSK